MRGRKRSLRLLLGLACSAILLYALFASAPIEEVAEAVASATSRWILTAVLAVAAAYALKILRWSVMLQGLGANPGIAGASTGLLGAVALNNVLPFRAGDVIRVLAFERLTGLPPSKQAGTLILERLLDVLSLGLIAFLAFSLADVTLTDERVDLVLKIGIVAGVAAVLAVILAPRPMAALTRWGMNRAPKTQRVGEPILRLLSALHTLTRWQLLSKVTALSLCAWLCEAGAFFAVGRSVGLMHGAGADLLAMGAGTLSTMIPSAPGYVGTFHYFTALVISAFGSDQATAAAYAILIHGVLWLSTTTAGFLLLATTSLRKPGRATSSLKG